MLETETVEENTKQKLLLEGITTILFFVADTNVPFKKHSEILRLRRENE